MPVWNEYTSILFTEWTETLFNKKDQMDCVILSSLNIDSWSLNENSNGSCNDNSSCLILSKHGGSYLMKLILLNDWFETTLYT